MPVLADLSATLPPGHGTLGLLSGDEFTPPARAFDDALFGTSPPRAIGVILCADHRAAPNSLRQAQKHFARSEVMELDMHGADLPATDAIYIAGGSPKDLLDHLTDNPRWRDLEARWKEGAILAGASAGAMVLCARTVVPKPGASVPTEWTDGLGILPALAVAVHADSRPREWLHELAHKASVPVLALDDATGIVLREGQEPVIRGPGKAHFL
jgi:hypothetical protein